VRELRGELTLERPEDGGTRFVLSLPLTVAVIPSLVFEAGGELLALPTTYVARTLRLEESERIGPTEVVRADGDLYPLADPDRLFGWPATAPGSFGVLVRQEGRGAVLRASRLVDQRDLVVKAMPRYGRRVRLVTGGSVLPGGRVVLLLDPGELIRLNEERNRGGARAALD
jgi:two-component system chemotaxis sensor kinase CheA